jgi:hypothetical protein
MANDDLNIANNAINNARGKMINNEFKRDRSNIVSSVAAEVARMFKPFLKEIRETAQVDKQDLLDALSQITVEGTPSNVTVPEIKVPTINVPEPRVHVTVPPIRVPDVVMPDEMNIRGFVGLMGVDLQNPLPVQLRDENGAIVNLLENITAISGGGGGGGSRGTVKIINDSGSPVPITGTLSATLSADTGSGEIGGETLRIVQATNAISSVNVVDAFGSTSATGVFNADNRVRVSVETGGSGLTDAELRATSVPVSQVSGATASVNVVSTVGLTDTELRASTLDVKQVSGASSSVNVLSTVGLTDTELRASTLDVKQVSGAIYSVEVTNIIASTTAIIGDKAADEADGDSNPIKVGGVARTANASAVGNGDRVSATFDTRGRQVVLPYNVRDLRATAYVSLATGTEATLLAASAGEFHDLVWVMGANQSDAAVLVDIRAVTAGNVSMSLEIPANSTAGIAPPIPYPQADTGNNWTVDMGDITGTTVDITALFTKEV